MTLSRRLRLAVVAIAAAPVAASMVALSSSPALAILSDGCNTNYVCFYANSNYNPYGHANDVLNYSITHVDWSTQSDPARICPGGGNPASGTWNDCASSIGSDSATLMGVYDDAHCYGNSIGVQPYQDYSNLNTSPSLNDRISADSEGWWGGGGC